METVDRDGNLKIQRAVATHTHTHIYILTYIHTQTLQHRRRSRRTGREYFLIANTCDQCHKTSASDMDKSSLNNEQWRTSSKHPATLYTFVSYATNCVDGPSLCTHVYVS